MYGELGAGKSTLSRLILESLCGAGFRGSPTYSIMNEYVTLSKIPVYHLDLYRIESEQEIYDAGIDDLLYENPGLCLIEWPNQAPDWSQAVRKNKNVLILEVRIDFSDTDMNARNITLNQF